MQRQKQKYTDASLAAALKSIRDNSMTIRAASREFGVPVTTLHDRVKGRAPDELQRPGPATVLTKTEERRVVEWLVNIAKCGFPQKPSELLDVVQKIIKDEKRKTPFKDDRPGKKWYYAFLKRHSELSLRAPETIGKARAIIREDSIRKWFSDLDKHLEEENCRDILDDPTRIFNGDETSFSLAPKTGSVIGPRGYRNVYQVKFANEKDNLTVLLVFRASGETLPPVIVFPYQKVPFKVVSSMPDDWVVGRSETGWMRTETFYEYIANDFSNWIDHHQVKRPILLLVDGHKSHISMHLSDFCSNNQIILYSLPANTTHIMQPADVGAFKGLKSDYRNTVRQWSSLPENHGKSVTKSNFCQLLKLVLDKSDRSTIVQNSFRKCGISPFNPDAIDYTKCVQNNLENLIEADENNSAITIGDLASTKKVLLSIENELTINGFDFERLFEIVTEAHTNLEAFEAPETLEFERSLLQPMDTDQLLEEAELAIAEAEIFCDKQMLDDVDPILPVENNKDAIEDINILEDAIDTILNCDDMQDCLTSSNLNMPSTSAFRESSPNARIATTNSTPVTSKKYNLDCSPSSSFEKFLKYPDAIRNKKGISVEPKDRGPMSISSIKWKNFMTNKQQIKESKKKEVENRKKIRQVKRLQNSKKKVRGNVKVSTVSKKSTKKEICEQCHDELDTDAEDDDLKNIGCDLCSKWYHLACTKLCTKSFQEAEKEDFVCDFCAQ